MSSRALETLPLLPTAGEVGIFRRLTKSPVIVDAQGRPLCEGHARSAPTAQWWFGDDVPARGDAPFEYAPCPYHDARRHHARPMNVTALAAIAEHWDDVIAFSSWLAQEHAGTMACAEEPRDSVALYQRVALLFAAPLCAFVRDPRVPLDPVVCSAWKAGLGFLPVTQALLIDQLYDEPRPMTGRDVYAQAQRSGALIGQREVCAGPPGMIVSTADALLGRAQVPAPALERARAAAHRLGDPADWLRAATIHADHWLVDKAVVLVASMIEEDWKLAPGIPGSRRRFPRSPESRLLLLEGLAQASIHTPEVQPVWAALSELVQGLPSDPRAAIEALGTVQQQALARMEAALRERLSLPPLPSEIRKSLCFVDLGARTVDAPAITQASQQLHDIASGMCLEPRIARAVVDLGQVLQSGAPPQPARVTAQLLVAHVRFARELARIEGLPAQAEAAERLAANVSAALHDVARAIRFGPTRALLHDLALSLAVDPSSDPDHARAIPGDAAAWLAALERFVQRKGLRVLAAVGDCTHLVKWLVTHVASHDSARVDLATDTERPSADATYDLAVVAGALDWDTAVDQCSSCWARLRPEGLLILVTPPRFPEAQGCPLQPPTASVTRVGGAWFVHKHGSAAEPPVPPQLRGCHGDNPFAGLVFDVEDT